MPMGHDKFHSNTFSDRLEVSENGDVCGGERIFYAAVDAEGRHFIRLTYSR